MQCKRCLNKHNFHEDEFGTYCRRCVVFGRLNINDTLKPLKLKSNNTILYPQVDYSLSDIQKTISKQLIQNIQNHQKSFVYAVCGAGKTEILLPLLAKYLNENKKIGIAIPRRQVVIELYERLKHIFPTLDIVCVCKGRTRKINAPLVICTTHQLYRYYKSFDILIIDEVDAFPYSNDTILHTIAHASSKQHFIYMSATMDTSLKLQLNKENIQTLTLFKRYHQRPLPIPTLVKMPFLLQIIFLFHYILKYKHLTKLVFLPTIKQCYSLYHWLKYFFPVHVISSLSEDKEAILKQLQTEKQRILITTTIMERGITIADSSVLVLNADHRVFTTSCLIQMSGRVDRKTISYQAPIFFLGKTISSSMKTCVQQLKEMNE